MAARRRRQRRVGPTDGLAVGQETSSGGLRSAVHVAGPSPQAPLPRQVHFADAVEICEVEDDGVEPYELGNVWNDGTPRVRYRTGGKRPYVTSTIAESTVRAHFEAMLMCAGEP